MSETHNDTDEEPVLTLKLGAPKPGYGKAEEGEMDEQAPLSVAGLIYHPTGTSWSDGGMMVMEEIDLYSDHDRAIEALGKPYDPDDPIWSDNGD